ncbi:longitudinals lacking protein, isoforms H/M/V-like isoform X8 [Penaeus japonicus]|uniref:longitudinals lacking protein, isoforms H/M/V-like isoform X8 n=1 Tax=Penaeus japonicus TaxID=27405 RepID=UPI001C70BF86|nr:longitudinals lacking protein, isoforms H/M/V-like isoform X8 [Penaeus japonicus]
MASGLLSLKWNNHRTTFFHVLSTIRSKESYCDATIACDGKFYPVHKLVLSTCSDYFEQMFERTNCKHPIIVLKDIRHEDLEALLNYMYVGEVNVLQNELAGLIKAAECLMIKGLAVPDEAPTKESKRSSGSGKEDSPVAKRRKKDDEPRLSATSVNQHVQRETRESPSVTSTQSQRHSASASIPTPSPTVSRTAPPPISPSPSIGSVSDAVSEDCSQGQNEGSDLPALSNAQDPKHGSSEQASSQSQQAVPEVILDEPGVKEEPQEVEEEVTETKEIIESQFSFDPLTEGDSRAEAGGGGNSSGSTGPPGFDPQMIGSQPQSMEELVAQAIPGSSGLQGNSVSLWEGDGSLQGFPMEGYSGDGSRPPQMDTWQPRMDVNVGKGPRRQHECSYCPYIARDKTDLRGGWATWHQDDPFVPSLWTCGQRQRGFATSPESSYRGEALRLSTVPLSSYSEQQLEKAPSIQTPAEHRQPLVLQFWGCKKL